MKILNMMIVIFLFAMSSSAYCQDDMQKALARAQYMLKQSSAEKSALQAKNMELSDQLSALQKKMDSELAKSEKENNKLKNNIGNWKEEYQKLKERYVEVSSALSAMAQDRDEKAGKLAMQTENFQLCFKDNSDLVKLNTELVSQFEEKGPWDALVQREPITGLGEVEMENLLQTYRHKIEDLDVSFNQHLIHKVNP